MGGCQLQVFQSLLGILCFSGLVAIVVVGVGAVAGGSIAITKTPSKLVLLESKEDKAVLPSQPTQEN